MPPAPSQPAPDRNVALARHRRELALRLPSGAELLDFEPGRFAYGALRNVMVVVWRRRATPEAVQRLGEAAARLHAKCPTGRSSVHVVLQGAEPPLDQAQAGFVRLMQQSQLSCFGVVFLGSGFWASVLRSQSTAMRQRADVDFPFRQYGSVEEVAAWLPGEHLGLTGVALDRHQLCRVIEVFVRELDAPG